MIIIGFFYYFNTYYFITDIDETTEFDTLLPSLGNSSSQSNGHISNGNAC